MEWGVVWSNPLPSDRIQSKHLLITTELCFQQVLLVKPFWYPLNPIFDVYLQFLMLWSPHLFWAKMENSCLAPSMDNLNCDFIILTTSLPKKDHSSFSSPFPILSHPLCSLHVLQVSKNSKLSPQYYASLFNLSSSQMVITLAGRTWLNVLLLLIISPCSCQRHPE